MDVGTVQRVDIEDKMRSAYLSYAMSVITARALPDVRDGLKPGQRRILYAMHDMGILHDRPTRKSARIVGEVLGKYHPHGDQAVYDAMVRMAQEFSLRYPLVEGQGNFGSIDGDSAAAMRYTEARLSQIGEEMLLDLDKDTVDLSDNFDGSLQEPSVLPSRLPNLLVNGVGGIAVGMATNIPPHNLGEVVDAIAFLIDQYDKLDDVTVDDLLKYIKGPDFPTAGSIYGCEGIRQAYASGKGRITVRALAHMEEMGQGKSAIIVTELPYQVNKSTLVERIASLVRDERIQGIADLRDESDRTGMRIVIELKRGTEEGPVMEGLLKYTQLQTTFGVNMLALVDGEPRSLPLKRCLTHYIEHRFEVIERRTRYDLAKAQARAHILEGLLVALDNLDEVIATIRRSRTVETARRNLCKSFSLSEIQAQAILDLQLRRLAALERRKIQEEYQEVKARIAYLQEILGDNTKILGIIKDDALELKRIYGDARRTTICEQEVSYADGLQVASMIPSEAIFALLTREGTVRRLPEDVYRSRRTTVPGMLAKERDVLQGHLLANSQHNLYFATNQGRAFCLPAHQLPDGDQQEGGLGLGQLVHLQEHERAIAILHLAQEDDTYLALSTTQGKIKRLTAADLEVLSRTPSEIIGLSEGDALCAAAPTKAGDEALLATRQGKIIRFELDTVRPQGLGAGGMRGISLQDGDAVVAMDIVRPEGQLVLVTEAGFGKRVDLDEYSAQGRGGQGTVTIDTSKQKLTGDLAAICVVTPNDELVLCGANHKMVRLTLADIPKLERATWGRVVSRSRRNALIDEAGTPVTTLVALPGLAGQESDASNQQGEGESQSAASTTRKRPSPPASTPKTPPSTEESEPADEQLMPPSRSRRASTRRTTPSKATPPADETVEQARAPEPPAEPKPSRRPSTRRTTKPPEDDEHPADDEQSAAPPPAFQDNIGTEDEPSGTARRSRRNTARKPPTRRK